MDIDSFSTGNWITIYEILDDDGELSKEGKNELERLRGYYG